MDWYNGYNLAFFTAIQEGTNLKNHKALQSLHLNDLCTSVTLEFLCQVAEIKTLRQVTLSSTPGILAQDLTRSYKGVSEAIQKECPNLEKLIFIYHGGDDRMSVLRALSSVFRLQCKSRILYVMFETSAYGPSESTVDYAQNS